MIYPSEESLYAAYCQLYETRADIDHVRGNQRWNNLEAALISAARAGEDPRLEAAYRQLASWKKELERLTLPLEQQLETGAGSYQELYLRYRRRCQQLAEMLNAFTEEQERHQAALESITSGANQTHPALGKAKPALNPVSE